jgi:hypothetical protein
MPVCLNRIALFGATGRRGPIVGIAVEDRRAGFERPAAPTPMREADQHDTPGTHFRRGAQIGSTVEGVARLRLWRHQQFLITCVLKAARTKAADQRQCTVRFGCHRDMSD